MKRSFVVMWALALFAVTIPLSAGAAIPVTPHLGSGISCPTCHSATALGAGHITTTVSSPAAYNNICQSCHRPGDGIAAAKPMAAVDASQVFGGQTMSANATKLQTSHRWDGSDTNPAAGALPPVQAAMTSNQQGLQGTLNLRGRSGNQLACVRCHSVHIPNNKNGSNLRMANNLDQMCMDCHRSRNQQSHLSGTHPVNVNYNAASGAFNRPPLNTTPANPTSDVGAKFTAGGNLVCSTCHGVHYTDSRSSTFDGASSARGRYNYSNLSTGDGYLLRTDRRGAAVSGGQSDALNICTNCHAGKKSHNAKDQDIQCSDCHGAHVEYDATNSSTVNPQNLPNVYLLRRNVIKSGQAGKIYFRYTGSQREYKNAQGTGVCQGCHDVPAPGGAYPPQHDSTKASDCNACHYHGSQAGSFSGACGKCHGNPPTTAATGGPDGLAAPATGALGGAAGAHNVHVNINKMDCNACHNGYASRTMPNATIDLGFAINGGNVPGFKGNLTNGTYNNTGALSNGYSFTGPVGSGANRTCANIYCHGATLTNGSYALAGKPGPSWTDGSSEAACGTCHGASVSAPPTSGSHVTHAGATRQMSCDVCHGVNTHNENKHVNGSVSWDLTAVSPTAAYMTPAGVNAVSGETGRPAPSATYGSCSSVYCHSSVQGAGGSGAPTLYASPTWGTTLTCGSCHADMSSAAGTGSHVTHAVTQAIACATCHSALGHNTTSHADGAINLAFSGSAAGGDYSKTGLFAPGAGYGSCSNVSCHRNIPATWGGLPGSNKCTLCHVGSAAYTGWLASKHYQQSNPMCVDCHTGAGASHPGAPLATVGTICGTCHTVTAAGNDPLHVITIGAKACVNCHNPHSTYADAKSAGASPAHFNTITSGMYPASYITSRSSCSDCHANVAGNAALRADWAASGHADIAAPAWINYDFKTRTGGCVRCHTTTGFVMYAYTTGKVNNAWGVASDKTKEVLTCKGCHSDISNGSVRSVPPIRPFVDEQSYTNRDLGKSNICMDCHSGRSNGSSITVQVDAGKDFTNLSYVSPHYLAAGAVLQGKAAYHFPGRTYASYSSNMHRQIGDSNFANTGTSGACVACHKNVTVDSSNGHKFQAVVSNVCAGCHGAALDAAQLEGTKLAFADSLNVLKAVLAAKGYVYSPNYPYFSNKNWGATAGNIGPNVMGAAFNYKLLQAEPGAFAHNPVYMKQLVIDSIDAVYNDGVVTGSINAALASLLQSGVITQAQADSVAAFKPDSDCNRCHLTQSGNYDVSSHKNNPFLTVTCADCHIPHNGVLPVMSGASGVCQKCHAPGSPYGIYSSNMVAKTPHGGGVPAYMGGFGGASDNASAGWPAAQTAYLTRGAICSDCHGHNNTINAGFAEGGHGKVSNDPMNAWNHYDWSKQTNNGTRQNGNCDRCHTAGGFLKLLGATDDAAVRLNAGLQPFASYTSHNINKYSANNILVCVGCHKTAEGELRIDATPAGNPTALSGGYFALFSSSATSITAGNTKIQVQFPGFKNSSICIPCHSGRSTDKVFVEVIAKALSVNKNYSTISTSYYQHAANMAQTFIGKGGFDFTGSLAALNTGDPSHMTVNMGAADSQGPCVGCHYSTTDKTHSLEVNVNSPVCVTCHAGTPDVVTAKANFDAGVGILDSLIREKMNPLRVNQSLPLETERVNIRFGRFGKTEGQSADASTATKAYGAWYNWQILASYDNAAYTHNPRYARQLLVDTMNYLLNPTGAFGGQNYNDYINSLIQGGTVTPVVGANALKFTAGVNCAACHTSSGDATIIANYTISTHKNNAFGAPVACVDCHTQHGVLPVMSGASGVCQKCHAPGSPYGIYSSNMVAKTPHGGGVPAYMGGFGGASDNASAGWPAAQTAYLTRGAICSDCHGHNNTINAGFAEGGHGKVSNDPMNAWNHYDWSKQTNNGTRQNGNCDRCHTAGGFLKLLGATDDAAVRLNAGLQPFASYTSHNINKYSANNILVCVGCHKTAEGELRIDATPAGNPTALSGGYFALFSSSATSITAGNTKIQVQFPGFKNSSICIPCHSGRSTDKVFVEVIAKALSVNKNYSTISTSYYQHAANMAQTFIGKGGFDFTGSLAALNTGDPSHMTVNMGAADSQGPCVGCHYSTTDKTHSLEVNVNSPVCVTCHAGTPDVVTAKANFDAGVGILDSLIREKMNPLRVNQSLPLETERVNIRFGRFGKTEGQSADASTATKAYGAWYNWQILASYDNAAYTHNPRYARQLLVDTMNYLLNPTGAFGGQNYNDYINSLIQGGTVTPVVGANALKFTAGVNCAACHTSSGDATIIANYTISTHKNNAFGAPVACVDCHTQHGVLPVMSGASGVCQKCHAPGSPYGIYSSNMVAKTPHGGGVPAYMGGFGGASDNASAGWPAAQTAYLTRGAICSDCHGHNNTINAGFAEGGHGKVSNDPMNAWNHYDWSKQTNNGTRQNGNCDRCHTAGGFLKLLGATDDAAVRLNAGLQPFASYTSHNINKYSANNILVCVGCHKTAEGELRIDATPAGNPTALSGGYFALFSSSATSITAGNTKIQVQFPGFKNSSICIPCHSGRSTDKVFVEVIAKALSVNKNYSTISTSYYQHAANMAQTFIGKGGFDFTGSLAALNTGDPSHMTVNMGAADSQGPCVGCHYSTTDKTHSLEVNVNSPVCVTCHAGTPDVVTAKANFDAGVGILDSLIREKMNPLRVNQSLPLETERVNIRFGRFGKTEGQSADASTATKAYGAWYNWQILASYDNAAYTHNPRYARQLLVDTMNYLLNPTGAFGGQNYNDYINSLIQGGTVTPVVGANALKFTAGVNCAACHTSSGDATIIANYTISTHKNNAFGAPVACVDCHTQHGVLPVMSGASGVCQKCHAPGSPYGIYSSNMVAKTPHGGGVPAYMGGFGGASDNASAGWPAAQTAYLTRGAICSDCHGHNNTINAGFAEGGHGKVSNDPMNAWNHYDWSKQTNNGTRQNGNCDRCHTAGGFLKLLGATDDAAVRLNAGLQPFASYTSHNINKYSANNILVCVGCHKTAEGELRIDATPAGNPTALSGGYFALFSSSATSITAGNTKIQVQFPGFKNSSICIPCHSGRSTDKVFVEVIAKALSVNKNYSTISTSYYQHAANMAQTFIGKGGFDFTGSLAALNTGDPSHMTVNMGAADSQGPCVGCHYSTTDKTHSLEVNVNSPVCVTCHAGTPDVVTAKANFDAGVGILDSLIREKMNPLRVNQSLPLETERVNIRFGRFGKTEGQSADASTATKAYGAWYNWQILASYDNAAYTHNPRYARQLLVDTMNYLLNPTGAFGGQNYNDYINSLIQGGTVTPVVGANALKFTAGVNCAACHTSSGDATIIANYTISTHKNNAFGAPVACVDCHTQHGVLPVMSGASGVCQKCHAPGSPYGIYSSNMVAKTPHGGGVPAYMGGFGGASDNASAGWPAAQTAYLTRGAICSDCHGHNNTINAGFAEGGHGKVSNDPMNAWNHYDWSKQTNNGTRQNGNCDRCHTAGGFLKLLGATDDAAVRLNAGLQPFASYTSHNINKYSANNILVCVGCHKTAEGELRIDATPAGNPTALSGGYFALFSSSATSITAGNTKIQVQFPGFKNSSICIPCHSGRSTDKVFVEVIAKALSVNKNYSTISTSYYQHAANMAQTFIGKGGFDFTGSLAALNTGDPSHMTVNMGAADSQGPCVGCHYSTTDKTHSLEVNVNSPVCVTCHAGTPDVVTAKANFDAGVGILDSLIREKMNPLRVNQSLPLETERVNIRFGRFGKTEGQSADASTATKAYGAWYNWQILASYDNAAYTHNPRYARQLLVDTMNYLLNPTGAFGGQNYNDYINSLIQGGTVTPVVGANALKFTAGVNCAACHTSSGDATIIANYTISTHKNNAFGAPVACVDCHTQHGVLPVMSGASGVCQKCHAPGSPYGVYDASLALTAPHQATKQVQLTGSNAPNTAVSAFYPTYTYSTVFSNMTSGFVTTDGIGHSCADCHGHNNKINAEWITTAHGNPNPLDSMNRFEGSRGFKYRGAKSLAIVPSNSVTEGCVVCHTTTGYVNFVTDKSASGGAAAFSDMRAWGNGYNTDLTNANRDSEQITCRACHTSAEGDVRPVAAYPAYVNYSTRQYGKQINLIQYSDFKNSNICTVCHGGRSGGSTGKVTIDKLAAFDSFTTLAFANPVGVPHGDNGLQAGILDGKMGYQFTAYTPADNGHSSIGLSSSTSGPCVTCHMDNSDGYRKHEFAITPETITNVCSTCHAANFGSSSISTAQTNHQAAVKALGELMINKQLNNWGFSIISSSTKIATGGTATWADPKRGPGRLSDGSYYAFTGKQDEFAKIAGAVYNYNLLTTKGDVGIFAHNPGYTRQLINDTIEFIRNKATTTSVADAISKLTPNARITAQEITTAAIFPTTRCSACHSSPDSSSGQSLVRHTKHWAVPNMNCAACHTGDGPGIGNHPNGVAVVGFPNIAPKFSENGLTASYNAVTGRCSNISCHGGRLITPTWKGSTSLNANACATNCHRVSSFTPETYTLGTTTTPYIGPFSGNNIVPNVSTGNNLHQAHNGAFAVLCTDCHTLAAHYNNLMQGNRVLAPGFAAATVGGAGTKVLSYTYNSPTSSSCLTNNALCHDSGARSWYK